ncbi:DUF6508 domain-containing protein [Paenibacillus solani]|uniref:DUF6508 domain-containing protein n=1 Tax=Paenibacillus solani TaxID=1705565 RepID=UPI003D2E50F8
MTYNSNLSMTDMDRLLSYLDYFQDPDSVFGYEASGYMCQSQEVRNFCTTLDDIGFLLVFNWHEWLAQHEAYKDLDHPIASSIMNADLDTLRKLMTSYIRGDRFNEGLFIEVCRKGHIASILLRLRELRE